jgi:hypothetical protein
VTWDKPSWFLFGGAILAAVILGWHIIATIMELME